MESQGEPSRSRDRPAFSTPPCGTKEGLFAEGWSNFLHLYTGKNKERAVEGCVRSVWFWI